MNADATAVVPTLLTADHASRRPHSAARVRFNFSAPMPHSVSALHAVSALIALISRHAREDSVSIFLTARARAAVASERGPIGSPSGAFVTIPVHAEPRLRELSERLVAASMSARAADAAIADSIMIDVGAPAPDLPQAELSLCLTPDEHALLCFVDFDAKVFDAATVERFVNCFARVLSAALADPSQSLERIPLLDDAEREVIVHAWNATTVPRAGEQLMHRLIEAQVARTPDAVAVEFDSRALSYRSLNARANGLARRLVDRGVCAGKTVAICFERSIELPIALLAVHKAGAAFLPLDPALPRERVAFMLADSATCLVLTGDRKSVV